MNRAKLRRASAWLVFTVAVCLAVGAPLRAEPPWQRMAVFRRVDADPEKSYPLTDLSGPWLILVKTFVGENAQEHATQLVLELRSRYKLKAYTHEMDFDFTAPVKGLGVDKYGAPKRMKHRRSVDGEEIGVLVGDFSAVDDTAAQEALKRLKYAKPKCLEQTEEETASSPLSGLRQMQQAVLADGNPKKLKGPMGHAFLVTNPLLPREYYVPDGPDRLVIEMNQGVEYSLLGCPGRYTVQVATFNGRVVVDQKKIRELEAEGEQITADSRLAEAADSAHRLTLALRKQGVEAYEFHDRYSSLVTVGSFDSVGSPRADGKTEINPEIFAIMKRYGAGAQASNTGTRGMIRTKSLDGIPFDAQPMPVEVPRSSLGSAYERPVGWTRR